MKPKTIALLEERDSPWYGFLSEYFEDSASRLHYCYEAMRMGAFLDQVAPDITFIKNESVTLGIAQKLKLLRQSNPDFRIFHLGAVTKPVAGLVFDGVFLEPINIPMFQKQMVQHLPLPEKIKVLVIDDEQEIGQMMSDYLESRVKPAFEIQYENDGRKALARLSSSEVFDVIVLDVKMPEINGREVYKELKVRGISTPVIIFFDAIFGDEMVEIHQYGRPAVVEKGSRTSAMPEMMALIKKMVYFG